MLPDRFSTDTGNESPGESASDETGSTGTE